MKLPVSMLSFLAILAWSSLSLGAGKVWYTFPNSSTIPPSKPQPINPGIEIPSDKSKVAWQITAKSSGIATGDNKGAPAYLYDKVYGLSFAGFVPEGTEVKLEAVNTFGRVHYYRIPRPETLISDDRKAQKAVPLATGKSKQGEFVWVSGLHIVAK
jgi:hypothetical protein